MRLSRRAAVVVALVPLGTVAGHAAGYVLAGRHPAGGAGHSHLRPATWLTAAVAALALGWVAAARNGVGQRPRVAALATAQAGLFVAMEGAEHLASGHSVGHLVAQPSLRWGLAAQLATAALLVLATTVAHTSGQRLRDFLAVRAPGPARPLVHAVRRGTGRPCTGRTVSPATERGPPSAHLVPS